ICQAEDGIRDFHVTGVQTCALPISERIKGEPAGPAADLYAWALTVAFTATGRHAFTGGTHQEVMARILYGKPDLGALSGRLRRRSQERRVGGESRAGQMS